MKRVLRSLSSMTDSLQRLVGLGEGGVYGAVTTDLPKAQTLEDLEALLPGAILPDQVPMVLPVPLPKIKNEAVN